MGADLILGSCPHPVSYGLSEEEAKALLRAFASSTRREGVEDYCRHFVPSGCACLGDLYEEVSEESDLDELADTILTEEEALTAWGTRYLAEALLEAYDEVMMPLGRRDVETISVGPIQVVVSGGMSWGDAPTEGMDYLLLLAWSGVFDPENFYLFERRKL
jgi:hypothetical protein